MATVAKRKHNTDSRIERTLHTKSRSWHGEPCIKTISIATHVPSELFKRERKLQLRVTNCYVRARRPWNNWRSEHLSAAHLPPVRPSCCLPVPHLLAYQAVVESFSSPQESCWMRVRMSFPRTWWFYAKQWSRIISTLYLVFCVYLSSIRLLFFVLGVLTSDLLQTTFIQFSLNSYASNNKNSERFYAEWETTSEMESDKGKLFSKAA